MMLKCSVKFSMQFWKPSLRNIYDCCLSCSKIRLTRVLESFWPKTIVAGKARKSSCLISTSLHIPHVLWTGARGHWPEVTGLLGIVRTKAQVPPVPAHTNSYPSAHWAMALASYPSSWFISTTKLWVGVTIACQRWGARVLGGSVTCLNLIADTWEPWLGSGFVWFQACTCKHPPQPWDPICIPQQGAPHTEDDEPTEPKQEQSQGKGRRGHAVSLMVPP